MMHYFDIDFAAKYGIAEAVILQNIIFWVVHNKANGTNLHDGHTWTFNSKKAFSIQFPYLSIKQIRNALEHLIEEGVLITGNYNKAPYDRTLWYALKNEEMHLPLAANASDQNGEPIPYINTDINTNRSDVNIGTSIKTYKDNLLRQLTLDDGPANMALEEII